MPKGAMSQAERQQIRVRLVGKKNQPGEWAEQLPPARDVLLKGDPTVVRTTGGLSHMISRLRGEEAIGCDLETTGLCPHANHPVTIQFGIEDGSSWIVDVTALVPGMKDWEPGDPLVDPLREIECPESLLELKAFFEDPSRPVLCFHNGCFDLQFLMALGIQCRHKLFDTLIAHRILTAGKEDHPALFSSLQWCAGHLLGVWVSKEEQHEEDRGWADKLNDPEALRYAGTDPLLPVYLRNGMRRPDGSLYSGMRAQIMRDKPKTGPGLKNIAAIDFGAVPATAEMCFSGLWFDPAVLKANLLDRQQREKEAHKQLLEEASTLLFEKTGRRIQRDLIGRPSLNFGSAPQVAKFLRDVGVNLPEGDSVDQQVLKLLVDPPAIIDTYLAWKDLGTQVKQLITFRDAISPATGRIHASFVQYGADSGQFTCRQPNCQNPSKHAGLRESVKPRPGNKFVICDYSGVEMRLMAALANDKTMLQAIKDGVDIHRFTASGIMKKPMEEISREERSQGKISGFALIYACSAETLKDYAQSGFGVVMTAEEAVRNRTGFFELYTGVAAFHGRIKEELFRLKRAFENDPEGAPPTYETRTLAGRRRTLPYGSMTAQTATNSPTQGSGADALLLAMGRMRKAWDDAGLKGWRIVNSVHDEIVAEGPEETAELACQIVKETMEAAGNQLVPAVPIAAEAGIADSWAEK